MKCLVEIKNYNYVVNKDEVIKFKNDLRTTNNNLGIFISFQTNICGKKIIDYETYDDKHIIYISNISNDMNKINCSILLLESIYKYISKKNIDNRIDQIKETIMHNFENLEELLKNISNLRNDYNQMEVNIKSSLDSHYNKLREYELDIKEKMQLVWSNLFSDLSKLNKSYIDNNDLILKQISNKSKVKIILTKLFEFLKSKMY